MVNINFQQLKDQKRRSFIFAGLSLLFLPKNLLANAFGIRYCSEQSYWDSYSVMSLFGRKFSSREEYFESKFGVSNWELPYITQSYDGKTHKWSDANADLHLEAPHVPERFDIVPVTARYASALPEDYEIEFIIEIQAKPNSVAPTMFFRYLSASRFKMSAQVAEFSFRLKTPGECSIIAAIKSPSLNKVLISNAWLMLNLKGCDDSCIYTEQSMEICVDSKILPTNTPGR